MSSDAKTFVSGTLNGVNETISSGTSRYALGNGDNLFNLVEPIDYNLDKWFYILYYITN